MKNQRMDEENVIHLHSKVLLRREKNNDILKFSYKWMELENTILSEATLIQKDEHGMYSLISGY